MTDHGAIALERMIANWYFMGPPTAPSILFNALKAGIVEQAHVFVAIEEMAVTHPSDPAHPRVLEVEETTAINFYNPNELQQPFYLQVFTSVEEGEKREGYHLLRISLRFLFMLIARQLDYAGLVINPWGELLVIDYEIFKKIEKYRTQSRLEFVSGSVLDVQVDAIVNAANHKLLGGGGIDGAIHRAAGPELFKACYALNGCPTGEAKLTRSFDLTNCDWIIHAVGPMYKGRPQEAALLASCYHRSLDLAYQQGCTSVAFPGISTGIYGYPLVEAAEIALTAVAEWLDAHPDVVMNLFFCCYRPEEREAYRQVLGS